VAKQMEVKDKVKRRVNDKEGLDITEIGYLKTRKRRSTVKKKRRILPSSLGLKG
jgi:hypothetical protein